MSSDPMTEQKVRKKLIRILGAWHAQYKDDPSMKTVANLYKQHRSNATSPQSPRDGDLEAAIRKSKEEAERKAKEEAERLKREEKKKKEKKDAKSKSKRKPFNFEEVQVFLGCCPFEATDLVSQEKPKILTQIANATQSANNLVNAITVCFRYISHSRASVLMMPCSL